MTENVTLVFRNERLVRIVGVCKAKNFHASIDLVREALTDGLPR